MTSRQSYVEVYRDDAREWRWRFRSFNGNVLADSGESYKRLIDCTKMAQFVCGLSAEARMSTGWHRDLDGSRRWYR